MSLGRELLDAPSAGIFREELVADLPDPGRRYLLHAIADGTPLPAAVRLATDFRMKLKEGDGQPVDLLGSEILAPPRGLVWTARGRRGALPFVVRDRYAYGQGSVNVYALRFLPIVRARGSDVDRSARGRLAIEAVWLPSALLPGRHVVWEGLSEDRARATLTIDGEAIPLTLVVGQDGALREITMMRHGNVGVASWQPIPYGVESEAEATFGGFTIPIRLRGGWWYGDERYDPASAAEFRVLTASFQ